MATKMKHHQYVENGNLHMSCKNNCGNYEVVGDNTVEVTCWSCVMKTVGVPKEKVSKPKSGRPAGWHFMNEFVDKDGNVFHKGKEQPDLKGTLPPTKVKPRKKRKKLTADQKLYKRIGDWKKRKKARRATK